MNSVTFTVFSKPWKLSLPELARHVAGLGFDGVELPVRPGYPVTPENIEKALPEAVRILGDHGLKVASIAGPTDERTFAACEASRISIVRICVGVRSDEPYLEGVARLQGELSDLVPALDRHRITLGLQNHFGRHDICNAMGLRYLAERFDPRHVGLVWDAGHNGLEGEAPETAIEIVWSHLCMVNLKSAFWRRTNGPEESVATWEAFWTTGRQGRANWPRVAAELTRRGYAGVVCLTAEYTDESAVDTFIAEDIAYARSLLG
ncbi:MAG: sugar phosphate isomerase/epimerase [Fimbriimonas sp.]|nr:sugar phosphate isomerase/epimerase [Fimbriimonas sp.]